MTGGLELSKTLLGALDDVGVEAAAETAITGHRHKGDVLRIAGLQQRGIGSFQSNAALEAFQHPGQTVGERTAAQDQILSAAHLGCRHQAHGFSDLSRVLDGLDPVADLFQVRHDSDPQAAARRPDTTVLMASLRMASDSSLIFFSL